MKLILTLLIASSALAARPPAPAKLPLVEMLATGGAPSDTFVVFVSGDGGWAKIDKSIAAVFNANGMPVVGLNALEYFWSKKTPEIASRDLHTIIETYEKTWKRPRVLVVGYSRGADVLPAMIARLPIETRSKIRLVALLGPSPKVQFEFHVSDWVRDSTAGVAVKPEVDKLKPQPILCLWGEDDKDSLCPALSGAGIMHVMMKGAHHFDGGYDKLGRIILDHLK